MHVSDFESLFNLIIDLNNQLGKLKQENENLKAQLTKMIQAQKELNSTKE